MSRRALLVTALTLCTVTYPAARMVDQGSPQPSAAAPSQAGAPMDSAAFRVRRSLPDGPPGLVVLPLDVSVLARSAGPGRRFADVRILDSAGRQIPYLLEEQDTPLTVDLRLQRAELKAANLREWAQRKSTYRVDLPEVHLPNVTLALDTSARVFTRGVSVGVERDPDRSHRDAWFETLANKTWTHTQQEVPAPPLSIMLGTLRDHTLIVVVDEGDNSALPVTAARLQLPAYRLRFFHPGAGVQLVYGRDDVSMPQYDLALVSPQVMERDARQIVAAPTGAETPQGAASPLSPTVFWAGLAVAVLLIGSVIVRLMRT
jgi:hypothetical protein